MSDARIETNPEVMLGKPVIRGTRVTVELLLRKLSEGASEDDDAAPHLRAAGFRRRDLANDDTVFVSHPG